MKSFIAKQDILYSSQYGFWEAHSTQHAILDIVDNVQTNMDNSLFSCGIFIDVEKAFDTVDHNILLNQPNHYGFRGLINSWFFSYLEGRRRTAQIGRHISEKANIAWVASGGYVLGPLLSLLYTNDIHNCSDKLKFYLFAAYSN